MITKITGFIIYILIFCFFFKIEQAKKDKKNITTQAPYYKALNIKQEHEIVTEEIGDHNEYQEEFEHNYSSYLNDPMVEDNADSSNDFKVIFFLIIIFFGLIGLFLYSIKDVILPLFN